MGDEYESEDNHDEIRERCSVCGLPALHQCERCNVPLCEVDLEHPLRMRWEKSRPIGAFGTSVNRFLPEGEWDVCKACSQRIEAENAPQIAKDRAMQRRRTLWGVLTIAISLVITALGFWHDTLSVMFHHHR